MSAKKKAVFTSDLDFCPDCGTVLPLPGLQSLVTCKKCQYQIKVEGKLAVAIVFSLNQLC
jgi:DNA-directed RNA polymerase I subunit RPA12